MSTRTERMLLLIVPVAIIMGSAALVSAQTTRIYISNDDHTDLMWAGNEGDYRDAWLTMLDYYLDQADQTSMLASDFQARFNTDGHYWMWTYEKNRSPAAFQRLIDRIRDGHITVPLQTLVMTYGGMPAEAVIRSMYYAGRIERRYGLEFELACAMENQTLPLGLPSLWAGAGAKYSWKGVCACATDVSGLSNRGREIYYAQGTDGRSVLLKWHSLYPGNNRHSGGYAENRQLGPAAMVDFVATDQTFRARYPFPQIVGIFGWGWDDLQTTTSVFVEAAQQKSDASRRVIVSNQVDFFLDYTSNVPSGLTPTYAASFGNDWDCNVATMAEVTASVKRAVEELRSAEALATLVSVAVPSFMAGREASADSAFNNIGLYFEHNWNNDGAFSSQRPAFNRAKATQVRGYVDKLKADAKQALAGLIEHSGSLPRLYVFNPLGWMRTDVADIPAPPTPPFRVVDVATGLEAKSQLINRNGETYLRILAEAVPPVGYRVYEIQNQDAQGEPAAAFSDGNTTFENNRYRVTVDGRGAIVSLADKNDGNRQWAQNIGGRSINDVGNGSGVPVPDNVGSVSATLLIDAGGIPGHRSRITLFAEGIDRIELEDEIVQNFFGVPPVDYAFGFNVSGQTTRHEEVGAIATARLLTAGGSYSPTSARYEYLTMNHFVDMSEVNRGVTLSNWDSQFFQLGNSSLTSLDVATPQIRAIVGGKLSPATNAFGGQDGDSYFLNRYAIQVHGPYDQAAAMRFALEHQNPLVAEYLSGSGSILPESSYSLLTVSDPQTILWALKPAEEGVDDPSFGGIIARVWNLSEEARELRLSVQGQIVSAKKTSHIETDQEAAAVSGSTLIDNLPSQWMQTYRLMAEITVPVELSSFSALQLSDHHVQLSWITLSEINTLGFEVQRKAAGQEGFLALPNGFVPGRGTAVGEFTYSFVDSMAPAGRLEYRLRQLNRDGSFTFSPIVSVVVALGVLEGEELPVELYLYQNYPNPFNSKTTITFDLPTRSDVSVGLYTVLGQLVRHVLDANMSAGRHYAQLNASDLSSGFYIFRLEVGSNRLDRTLLLIR